MKTLEHLKETAIRSFGWISQNPEGRGNRTINEYSEELDSDIEKIKSQGANEEQIQRYKNGYESKFKKWLHSQSNTASTFVTGGSNFPVKRQEKLHKWADAHYSNFREWREKVLKAYDKYERKANIINAGGELEIAKKKLEQLQINRELEKEANKKIKQAIKDMVNIDQYLLSLGVQPHMIEWTMKFGFGSCNTNANIRNTKKRIEELEQKQEKKSIGNKEVLFDGGKVIFNYEIDRQQIAHESKPSPEKIAEIKSCGFRWSPFHKVWQRQLSNNAIYSANRFLKIEL